jgi:hypothetical protein
VSKPTRVADLLKDVLRSTQTQVGRRELNEALAEALGQDLAGHCWVAGFRAGKLVVETDSAPLYSELTGFRREAIRLAMNKKLKQQKVAQLVFRMGGTGHV